MNPSEQLEATDLSKLAPDALVAHARAFLSALPPSGEKYTIHNYVQGEVFVNGPAFTYNPNSGPSINVAATHARVTAAFANAARELVGRIASTCEELVATCRQLADSGCGGDVNHEAWDAALVSAERLLNSPPPPIPNSPAAGTFEAIIDALCDFAVSECGHNPASSRHALTTVRLWVADAKRQLAELAAERNRLRAAVADAGFAVMETSGRWSIHDMSERAKADDERTSQVIAENIDLLLENKRLAERVASLENRVEQLRCHGE